MLALRYVYVLALVVWLGGWLVLGFMAPTTVQVLEAAAPATGRALGDALLTALLGRFHYAAYAAGSTLLVSLALMAILGPRPAGLTVRLATIVIMTAATVYSGAKVGSEIERLQSRVGTVRRLLPPDDPQGLRVTHLRQVSSAIWMFDIVAGLALLYWEARESGR